MQRKTATRRGVLTVAGGALAALAGCADGTDTGNATGTGATGTDGGMAGTEGTMTEAGTEGGEAMLRVAHLSPDAPNVDIAIDGEPVLEDVAFETVSPYQTLAVGEYQVTVTPTGGESPVFDQTVPVESGQQTAAAIGTASGEPEPLTVTLFQDGTTPPESGMVSVRAVHAIPDAGAVDVTSGEAVIADGLEYGSASEYVSVPADVTTVELRPDSEGNDAEPVGTFEVELTDGAVQTAFATGLLEGEPAPNLVLATDTEPGGMGTDTAGMGTETDGMGTETATGTDGAL